METTNKNNLKPNPSPIIFMNDEENLPAAIFQNVCVEFVNLDEGLNGDFDPNDPEDVNLLRFDAYVYEDENWTGIEDASYCTLIPADTDPDILGRAAVHMAQKIAQAISDNTRSVKIVAGLLSWLSDEDFASSNNDKAI
ncbi:MAG: hypothetical protein II038_12615 [Lachnospiraceae bacterium]|nr:hypothetical protein [Lachnospiraceae bacterium]